MNWAAIIWLLLLVVFLVTEASTVTMVSLWFAAGSLVAMIASLLGAAVWLQCVLFVVVSAISLWAFRPLVRRHITPNLTKTNVDAVVGSMGIVTAVIDNEAAAGQVKLGAMEWTARSVTGEPIEAGTLVKVVRIEGVKAFVEPAEVKSAV